MRYTERVGLFKNSATESIYDGTNSTVARRLLPQQLHGIAVRKLDMLLAASSLADLRIPPSNHLEHLKGNRQSQHSIRINSQYRICFRWTDQGAREIEVTDYH